MQHEGGSLQVHETLFLKSKEDPETKAAPFPDGFLLPLNYLNGFYSLCVSVCEDGGVQD